MIMMGGYGLGMGLLGWLLMGLFWLVLMAVVIWAVVRLLPARGSASGPVAESALDILDRRYARGEIDTETYQLQRRALAEARGEQRWSQQ